MALYAALLLALALLILDRSALYLHRPGQNSRAVVIYTAAWCPYCKTLRAYLDNREIPYSEYDVEKTFHGGVGFWALRGTAVPVSVVGPDIIYGFDMVKINEALQRLDYTMSDARNNKSLEPDGGI